jgi:hypothetical protein
VTLVDRYIAEVARRLPRRRRGDISRELRSTLLDTLESRFGPSASEDNAADVLREFGSPSQVAASYAPSNQYLIGPMWYGPFSTVLRISMYALVSILVVGYGVQIFIAGIRTNLDVGHALGELLGQIINIGLISFGTIVLVFHLLERSDVTANLKPRPWNPRDLPDTPARSFVGRVEAISIIGITAVYVITLFQLKNTVGLTTANGHLLLNDVYRDNLPWMAAMSLLMMGQYLVLLWQGRWRWYTRLSKFLIDGFGLWVVYRIAAGVIGQEQMMLDGGVDPAFVNVLKQIAYAGPPVAAAFMAFEWLKLLGWRRA